MRLVSAFGNFFSYSSGTETPFCFFEKNLSTSFPPEIFINCLSYNIRCAPVCPVLLFQKPFFLFFGKSDADGFGLWVWFHKHLPQLTISIGYPKYASNSETVSLRGFFISTSTRCMMLSVVFAIAFPV